MRGLRVALVERDDFASGTSSRSSRLVHGGVRYLEHGYLRLVFEASRERRTLLRIAPHLVRPLQFTWPVYENARIPRWKLGAGLLLYDLLALFRNVGRHERLAAPEVLAREPALRPDLLRGGATYFDAATDDARLTLANALAAAEAGAAVLNHCEATALARAGGDSVVRVRDRIGGTELEVRARVVVSAAGPWGDEVRRLEEPAAGAAVRGTKGVHVAVPRDRLGNRGAVTLLSPLDGRVMFALPSGPLAVIGTTDTPTSEHPAEVRASRADVDYLLRSANAFFPAARLTSEDVVSAWAGIRPLAASGYKAGGAPASASREHAIAVAPSGLIHVSGGKLTTFRSMATEIVDAAARRLGRDAGRSTTDLRALPGGDVASVEGVVSEAARVIGREDVAARLVRAHGSRWRRVWALAAEQPALGVPLVEGLPYVGAEMVYGVRFEMAARLGDLLIRRTQVAFETRDHGLTIAPRVAELVGWGPSAVEDYRREVERLFRIEEGTGTAFGQD